MNKILDGKVVSLKIKDDLKQKILTFKTKPTLVVIQIGNNEASNVYIKAKEKASKEIGINFKHLKFDEKIEEKKLINKIQELNNDDDITGMIIQLPLSKHLNERNILEAIKPEKDVDGLTKVNLGSLLVDDNRIISCTPLGIITLLEKVNIDLEGKHVVIVGRSNLVGKPLANLCLNKNATVTVCHSKTVNLENHTKQADILIVAAGKKDLINGSMIKDGVIIIDVGTNKVDGKLYGDVTFEDVYEHVSLITPVPGGVGPMTVAMLLNNVVKCYKNK